MKLLKLTLFSIMLLLFSSCNLNFAYRPTTVKPHLFTKKGDVDVGLNLPLGGHYGELYGSYAITDKLGLGAGYYSMATTDTQYTFKDTNNNKYKTRIGNNEFELHGIFFRKEEKNHIFELQAGFAIASTKFTVLKYTPDAGAPVNGRYTLYNRYFFMPSYGKTSKNIDWAFSARLQYIDYKAYNDDILFEPTFMARYGFANVKFMTQIGLNTCPVYKSGTDYTPITLGMGINFMFNTQPKPVSSGNAGYKYPFSR